MWLQNLNLIFFDKKLYLKILFIELFYLCTIVINLDNYLNLFENYTGSPNFKRRNFTQLYRTPNGTTFTPTTFFVSALISRKLQKTIIF